MASSPSTRVVYLHGLPGSVEEAHAALGMASLPDGVLALDRLQAEGKDFGTALLASFDQAVAEPCVLVGFSLGAMSALTLAARRPRMVRRVVLISPAAPLELGDFLPHMAGRAVFEAARRGRWALSALSMAQALAARLAPGQLLAGMFSQGAPAELALSAQPVFHQALLVSLHHCLTRHRAAYHRELLACVTPWSPCLGEVRCAVQILHGDADTWAPVAMAEALKLALPGPVDLRVSPRLGHFSMLHAGLREALEAAMSD